MLVPSNQSFVRFTYGDRINDPAHSTGFLPVHDIHVLICHFCLLPQALNTTPVFRGATTNTPQVMVMRNRSASPLTTALRVVNSVRVKHFAVSDTRTRGRIFCCLPEPRSGSRTGSHWVVDSEDHRRRGDKDRSRSSRLLGWSITFATSGVTMPKSSLSIVFFRFASQVAAISELSFLQI
jgi:hypothetical protein